MGGHKLIVKLTPMENKEFSAAELGVKYLDEKPGEGCVYIKIQHPKFPFTGEAQHLPVVTYDALREFMEALK